MIGIEAITQPRDPSGDLVELDTLLASIWHGSQLSRSFGGVRGKYIPRFLTYISKGGWWQTRGVEEEKKSSSEDTKNNAHDQKEEKAQERMG